MQQVDFAVKLGYTEKLVKVALSKLGGQPDKDELLAELIRLGNVLRPEGDADNSEGDSSGTVGSDSRIEQQQEQTSQPPALRPIIIDGSNIAIK